MTTAESPQQGRILQFDGLRAYAALAVFLYHGPGAHLFCVGVDVFFVLSGFLITSILLDRKQQQRSYFSYFYTRRAFRILPAYFVSIAVALLVYGLAALHFWPYFLFFAMNFLGVLHPQAMYPPFWSLAVEEQFYLLWPLLLFLCSERWVLRLSVCGIVAAPLLRLAAVHAGLYQETIYMLTPFRADLLCAGALLAWLVRNHHDRTLAFGRRWASFLAVGGFVLMAVTQIFPSFRLRSNQWPAAVLLYSISVVACFFLVLWALVDRGWLFRVLTPRPVRYLGQISYMFYLTHFAFLDLLRHLHCSEWLVVLGGFILTTAFSAASWHLMERPLIALGARLAPGTPTVPKSLPSSA